MRPGRINPIFFLPLFLIACGDSSNPISSGDPTVPITTTDNPGDPVILSLSDDLTTLKVEVQALEAMVWDECSGNCNPPKAKKLIKRNKVNSPSLENQIWGMEVDKGYSWDKEKYFNGKTIDDFLREHLKEDTLKSNLDRLCGLKETIPIDNGKFETGNFAIVDNPNIEINCGVLIGVLNLGTSALVEEVDEGGFDQKITLEDDVIYLKLGPDDFSFGQYSSTVRRRVTYDKVKEILSVETLKFLPGQDSLLRIFYDGVMGKAALLTKEVDPEEMEIAYSAEMGMLVPRFAKLDIKAESLGGVEPEAPEASGCIDLETGLISQYSYDNCPMDFGLSLADTNPDLLGMNYTPIPDLVEILEFISEDDVYLKDL